MRIACVQFSAKLGAVEENIARANSLLSEYSSEQLDLLVLPELAFSGYNFPSLAAIRPFLEPSQAGPSTKWAQETASRLACIVTVGYPEISTDGGTEPPVCYNSTITVSPSGDVLAHYRKTHLYYTDESWAQESPTGWLTAPLPLPPPQQHRSSQHSQQPPTLTAFGICMDLNPHKFLAPSNKYEYSTAALLSHASLLLLSMAWLTTLPPPSFATPTLRSQPDLDTLGYWCSRLRPFLCLQGEVAASPKLEIAASPNLKITASPNPEVADEPENEVADEPEIEKEGDKNKDVIIAVANRSGEENGVRYAGTSWIGRLRREGEIGVWGMLGRGEEGVLRVDTEVEGIRWVVEMGGEE